MGSTPLLARKASGPLRRAPNLPPPTPRGHSGMKSRDGASPGGPCSPGHPRPRHVSPGGVPHPAAWQQAPSAARPSGAALLTACSSRAAPAAAAAALPPARPRAYRGKEKATGSAPPPAPTPLPDAMLRVRATRERKLSRGGARAVKRGSPPEHQRVPAAVA